MDIADKIEEIFDIKLLNYQKEFIRFLYKDKNRCDKFIIMPKASQRFDRIILLTIMYELYKEELNK